jgi:hypothetical protein
MPVKQYHRWTVTPDADPQPHTVVHINPSQRETLEHLPILPRGPRELSG